ncbi:hypothetical protein CC78DRAFT_582013 [Lojkania enalia]|uniref:Uncharacterized protein n=1 Tax=Lojkania enalia TaxID=147567 RepID=A0A9P4K6E8_9PLEO|nr:hypothetical protein CC78DRAFT_582013 [Didymosphaeria enalia]
MKFITAFLLTTALAQYSSIDFIWYSDSICQSKPDLGHWMLIQGSAEQCIALTPPTGQQSTRWFNNNLTKPITVYNQTGCYSSSNHYNIIPKQTGCFAQAVRSIKFS